MEGMETDLKLWKANVALRKMFGNGKDPVWFVVTNEKLNALAKEHPCDYLTILNRWMHMLFGQTFYRIDGRRLDVACYNAFGGNIESMTFECEMLEDRIEVLDAHGDVPTEGGWKSMKKQGRK